MQAPYTDRWERTKRYLLRNFLVNPGFRLSPIPEEERSSPDTENGSLPDLVVEPAPNRHDHPPDFYEGLERRMKRYYRQLFLGENEKDDVDEDSSDFEVNQSMASTFVLNTDTRKDKEANVTAEEYSITGDLDDTPKKRRLTKSTNESHDDDASEGQDKCDDKLIDTCATYNDTEHISADSKSSVEDENPMLIESHSTNESNHSNKTDDDPNEIIEANGSTQSDEDKDDQSVSTNRDRVEKSGEALKENEDNSKIETKSDSDGSAACHRISTTVAEIHEARAVRDPTHVFDNGSPVLIPRLLQFSRRIFGSGGVIRKSGQSFNVSEASDEFIRRLSSHKSDGSNKQDDNIEEQETEIQRLLTASELTRASLDSDKILDKEKVVQYIDTEETNQDDANKNDAIEDKALSEIQSDNEGKMDTNTDETEITGVQNASIDWNKDDIDDDEDCFDNAIRRGLFASKARKMVFISSSDESFDDMEPIAQSSAKSIDDEEIEVMRDARVTGIDESWHGEEDQDSPALAFEAQTDADKLENESSDSTEINASFEEDMEEESEDPYNTPRNIAKIIDEFWSVSPEDVDIETPKERVSYGSSKRKIDSSGDAPSTKRKKDIAIQTGSEETHRKWEDIRTELFVGTPLVFRLCNCPDHICS